MLSLSNSLPPASYPAQISHIAEKAQCSAKKNKNLWFIVEMKEYTGRNSIWYEKPFCLVHSSLTEAPELMQIAYNCSARYCLAPRALLLKVLHCVSALLLAIRPQTSSQRNSLFVAHQWDIQRKASAEKFLYEVLELQHFLCLTGPGMTNLNASRGQASDIK